VVAVASAADEESIAKDDNEALGVLASMGFPTPRAKYMDTRSERETNRVGDILEAIKNDNSQTASE